ncbi:hypothetical protein EDC96DRAFT_436416 [Choanephora cucurbitarum]|nr:hypothetical protein EDC96DRAFT_436416 [Choanephora cucurbitarum]
MLPILKQHCQTYFWIDVTCPTNMEMSHLQNLFHIHPLTVEDIVMEEPREKFEAFQHYYFICFRAFEPIPQSPNHLGPVGVYILVFRNFVLSFHFTPLPHPANIRRRMLDLNSYLCACLDWICYSMLDDIVDSFLPLIKSIECEVDSIDELVLMLKETEQSDMLRRIGHCRKKIMVILRLLVSKQEVIKKLIQRSYGIDQHNSMKKKKPFISKEIAIYLSDVQDHVVSMLQSLNHYEKISSRSHSNYLAQISIEMTQTNNEINDVLSKLTALGSVMIPMNLVTGLFGMNVKVPGQFQVNIEKKKNITKSDCLNKCIRKISLGFSAFPFLFLPFVPSPSF